MKISRCFFAALALCSLLAPARAQVSAAVRESAGKILAVFGPKVAGETVEEVSKKLAGLAAKYGEDVLPAFTKVGPSAFAAAEEAAEFAAPKLKLMARQGSDALWITADPKKMAIFAKNGDMAADAMLKHKGIADAVLEKWGSAAAKPLVQVSPSNAKRLAIMTADGDLARIGKTDELLGLIGKYGDSAMDFVWRNKGALFIGANLAAFLANPGPYIDGAVGLIGKPLEPIGRNTNWTIVILFVISLVFLGIGGSALARQLRKTPVPSTQVPIHHPASPNGDMVENG